MTKKIVNGFSFLTGDYGVYYRLDVLGKELRILDGSEAEVGRHVPRQLPVALV